MGAGASGGAAVKRKGDKRARDAEQAAERKRREEAAGFTDVFRGMKPGSVFKKGTCGQGYYSEGGGRGGDEGKSDRLVGGAYGSA